MSTTDSRSDFALRALVTLVALVVFLALRHTAFPYADRIFAFLEGAGVEESTRTTFSLGAMGVTSFVESAVFVEIVAVLVPSLRARRHGGPSARRWLDRTALILGVAFALAQAAGIAFRLGSIAEIHFSTPQLVIVGGSLAGSTLALYAIARFVDRHGIGSGVFAMVALAYLEDAALRAYELRTASEVMFRDADHRGLLFPLALAAGTWLLMLTATLRRFLFRKMQVHVALPASGALPLVLVSSALTLAVGGTFAATATFGAWWSELAVETRTLASGAAVFAFALALGELFVPRAAWLRTTRAAGLPDSEWLHTRRVAILGSAIGLVVIQTLVEDALVRRSELELAAGLGVFAQVAAWLLDVGSEVRFRLAHENVEAAAELHAPFAVPAITETLDRETIPFVVRSERTRALLQVLGSYAPLVVLVRSEDVTRAREAIAPILAAITKSEEPALDESALARVFE